MFLRGQAVSRVPAAILRFCGNSAPSTSISANLSRVSSPLSRCTSRTIATSTPRHFEFKHPVGCNGPIRSSVSFIVSTFNGFNNNRRTDDEKFKTICIFLGTWISTFYWLLAMHGAMTDRAIPEDAEHIDCDTFAEKYMGKIQKIVLFGDREKAVGTLYPGAIIDGKRVTYDHVIFPYIHKVFTLRTEVRNEEMKKGISLGMRVEEIQRFSNVAGVIIRTPFLSTALLIWSSMVASLYGLRGSRDAIIARVRAILLFAVLIAAVAHLFDGASSSSEEEAEKMKIKEMNDEWERKNNTYIWATGK